VDNPKRCSENPESDHDSSDDEGRDDPSSPLEGSPAISLFALIALMIASGSRTMPGRDAEDRIFQCIVRLLCRESSPTGRGCFGRSCHLARAAVGLTLYFRPGSIAKGFGHTAQAPLASRRRDSCTSSLFPLPSRAIRFRNPSDDPPHIVPGSWMVADSPGRGSAGLKDCST